MRICCGCLQACLSWGGGGGGVGYSAKFILYHLRKNCFNYNFFQKTILLKYDQRKWIFTVYIFFFWGGGEGALHSRKQICYSLLLVLWKMFYYFISTHHISTIYCYLITSAQCLCCHVC